MGRTDPAAGRTDPSAGALLLRATRGRPLIEPENQAEGFVDVADLCSAQMTYPERRSRRLHDEFEGFPRSLLAKEDT